MRCSTSTVVEIQYSGQKIPYKVGIVFVQIQSLFMTMRNAPLFNITLSFFPDSCVEVGVRFGNWSSGVTCCPNCRHELRVTLGCGSGKQSTPNTPPFTIQPTYLPQTYLTPPSPTLPSPYNEEFRRLTDTLRALRLSGWYYGNLDWQVCSFFVHYVVNFNFCSI